LTTAKIKKKYPLPRNPKYREQVIERRIEAAVKLERRIERELEKVSVFIEREYKRKHDH